MVLYSLLKDRQSLKADLLNCGSKSCVNVWPKFTFVHAKQVVTHINTFTLSPWFHKNNFQVNKEFQVWSGQEKRLTDYHNVQQCIDLFWMVTVCPRKKISMIKLNSVIHQKKLTCFLSCEPSQMVVKSSRAERNKTSSSN